VKLIGIVLIVVGLAALAIGGISYIDRDQVADIGPIDIQTEERKTIPLSPVFGIAAIAGGIALVAVGSKTKA
jgi:hypothetical protein